MILTRHHLEKFQQSKRDNLDRRKKVAWAVFSYFSETGEEYRKSFTAPQGSPERLMWEIAPKTIEQ